MTIELNETEQAAEHRSGEPLVRPMPGGRIGVQCDGEWIAVTARPCFPWSARDGYVSLRDDEQKERLFIETLDTVDAETARLVREALEDSGFRMTITRITAIDDTFELRQWDVETRQGPRRFQTAKDEWPSELPTGVLLIHDVCGDVYVIEDPNALDAASQDVLWAYRD